ncbi:60s acidic ribosomal protein-domain-containing protein [Cladochytrium replicatum]|nr:60s acidic ribosomal protein-domain-containing protein [Cladochytrium replicatum]
MSLSASENACVLAALILHDEGIEVTADKLKAIIDAAGVEIEPIWPSLFAKALAGKDIGSYINNVGGGAAVAVAAPVAAAPAAGGAAPAEAKKEEKKKEEVKEESDDDMGFGLFD